MALFTSSSDPSHPTSSSQQPATSSTPTSSLWDRNPPEIITAILNSSDFLTRYLNNNLTKTEIQQHATEIWNEAFKQDWPGDLASLPSFGFPTATTGLCNVHTKSMLNRLRLLRPDLDIRNPGMVQDSVQITFRNNTNFGWFPDDGSAPIVLLDFTDTVEPGGAPIFNRIVSLERGFNSLSTNLLHISMRQCWLEDLELYITDNPMTMAKYAIHGDHFDLLKYLADTTKSVDLAMLPIGFAESYVTVAKNNNLDMFMYLHEKGCFVADDGDRRWLLTQLVTMGRPKFLHYIHGSQMVSNQEVVDVLSTGNHIVTDLDFWEWLLDTFCSQRFDICELAPIASDLKSAERIVAKLGTVNLSILTMNAYQTSEEAFRYLWQHRSDPDPIMFRPDIHNLEADIALWKLADLTNVRNARICSLDAYRRAHENGRVPNCNQRFIRFPILLKNLSLLQAIHEVCKCPTLKFSCKDMDFALNSENMEAVKFLHENRSEGCSKKAFLTCIQDGLLESVKVLYEHRRVECNLEEGLDLAVRSGHLNVVKYLVQMGGNVVHESLIGCIKNGYIHTVKYLIADKCMDCSLESMDLALKSGSLRLVRYLKGKFTDLKVTINSLREVMEAITQQGARVQMVHFLLTHCADCLVVEKVYSAEWRERYWQSFDGRVVEYLMENEDKLRRVVDSCT
ncbi:hypothetical protein HDU76_013757 [Blyttiomyces sp. JEL0837]|nr:hypothetical protein HDU76_013757 [Blyttiomyces sp. JEL0837]